MKGKTNPRPVPAEIHAEGAPPPSDPELAVDLAGAVGGGAGCGVEAAGEGEAAVELHGGALGVEEELLEAYVGAPPRVLERLSGSDPLSEAVEVAAAEGLDDGHLARGGASD